jgi:hypothetical protein
VVHQDEGAGEGGRFAALPHHRQGVEVMGWIDGGGSWDEETRGVMPSVVRLVVRLVVLDFVDAVERISP